MTENKTQDITRYENEEVRGILGLPNKTLVARRGDCFGYHLFIGSESIEAEDASMPRGRFGVYVASDVKFPGGEGKNYLFYTIEAFEQFLKNAQDALEDAKAKQQTFMQESGQ